jgi:thiosulfate/3-mercaptopyruvate sulfurtransferase
MSHEPLVSARELDELIRSEDCLVFDCRFDLTHPQSGYNSWRAARIPGAVYAHLDEHLSSPIKPESGRHPLPHHRTFASFLARSGWRKGRHVVAYDASAGAIASRLWWLMQYFGLGDASLLDGGINAWIRQSLPRDTGPDTVKREATPALRTNGAMKCSSRQLQESLEDNNVCLLDARAAERFLGELEPLDTVAGHVTGALNHPYNLNLGPDGCFLSPKELRTIYEKRVQGAAAADVVHMCGSGVTACHNVFAMELAGLKGSKLYPGSWSEWIRDPDRPVVTGSS